MCTCISACGHASACDLHLSTSTVVKKGVSEESRKKRNMDGRMDQQMGRQLGWLAGRPSYRDARIHLKIFAGPVLVIYAEKQVEQLRVTMQNTLDDANKVDVRSTNGMSNRPFQRRVAIWAQNWKKKIRIKYMNVDLSDLLRCQNASLIGNDAEATL